MRVLGPSFPDQSSPEIMIAHWQALTAESAACKEPTEKETYEDSLLHSSAPWALSGIEKHCFRSKSILLKGIFGAHEERV